MVSGIVNKCVTILENVIDNIKCYAKIWIICEVKIRDIVERTGYDLLDKILGR